MELYRRRLPHWIPDQSTLFLSWRLAGSPPPPKSNVWRQEPVREDRGPMWLADARIAQVVADALHYGAQTKNLYTLQAWVIMPNHMHVVWTPNVPLREITYWLKARTARVANRILGHTGPFWREESYDHWIRSQRELAEVIAYMETNPVKAGLVESSDLWPWSSASAGEPASWTLARQATKSDDLPHG